jgi:DNA-binding CsgD family transcriptional regulator
MSGIRIVKPIALSKQEARVLKCSIAGLSDQGIADELGLSLDTVRTYWQRIRAKSGGGPRAEVIACHVEAGARVEIEAFSRENDRLQEEIALRKKSEYWLKQAHALAKMGCWERDIKTDVVTWNETLPSVLGMSLDSAPRDLNGYLEFIHEQDRVRCREAVTCLVRFGTPYELSYRYRHPGQEERLIHSRGDAEFDEEGSLVRVWGTIQDVTCLQKQLALLGNPSEE